MRANCWYGKTSVSVEEVPDPQILNQRDAIVKISSTAICGSDLHLYNGFIPTMQRGDILGHEFMGEVVEVGREVTNLKIGDRVVVPFPIACGNCFFCKEQMFSLCENSNPNAWMAEKMFGHAGAGLFGYSHLTGGFAGGQAEYARVPFADVGPIKVPDHLSDEQVLFLSDIFPTGYMGAEMCDIQPGDTIAIWGCGPVGQFSIRSAFLLGAERVIAIDQVPERLRMAEEGGAETINYEEQNVYEALMDKTGQAHVQRYMQPLLEMIENGDIDPSFVITHTMSLEDAPRAYDMFKNKKDNCIKIVLKPDWSGHGDGASAKDDSYT